MTHPEQILKAVALLVGDSDNAVFTRQEIRHQIGVDLQNWNASYSPVFQGMRQDQPGGAPNVGVKFKGVFRQVSHGKHTLTVYGQELVKVAVSEGLLTAANVKSSNVIRQPATTFVFAAPPK